MLSNFVNKSGGRIGKGQQDEVLHQILENERSITVVDCGKELEEDFVAELCRALQKNRYVTTFRIRDRELGVVADPLAALCTRTTTLVTLKVSYANLTDHDALMICGALIKNRSIQHLSLDHNRIAKADGITLLLQHNKTLDSLDVSFNNLGVGGDRPIFEIAEALGRNATLKQLYLSGNGLSDTAARRLVESLDQNLHTMRLRVLDIAAENSVRSETKQSLKLVLEAGRQAQQHGGRDDAGDDLRSQLTGMGLTAAAGVLSGGPVPAHVGAGAAADDRDGISESDVLAWQQQVAEGAAGGAAFDEERRELQAAIDRLKEEKEQSTRAQIAALEQANRMQQQVAVLGERNGSLQRELDAVSAKYDRKVRESGEATDRLQEQLKAARKELVRQQEAAAKDRARLVTLQEGMTEELTRVHEMLAAATRANDLLEHLAPPTTRRPMTVDAEALTDLTGAKARAALAPDASAAAARAAPSSSGPTRSDRRSNEDAFSDVTGDVSVQYGGPGRRPNAAAPTPMPRNEWLDDDAVHDCKSCRRDFTITRRKHHCRLCGHVYCGNCAPVQKQWDMRVCHFCLATHT